jgi:hypothetical protein
VAEGAAVMRATGQYVLPELSAFVP